MKHGTIGHADVLEEYQRHEHNVLREGHEQVRRPTQAWSRIDVPVSIELRALFTAGDLLDVLAAANALIADSRRPVLAFEFDNSGTRVIGVRLSEMVRTE